MSLRRDVHAAFDQIAPLKLGMSERVLETVLRDRPRQRSRRVLLHMRTPLALVATILLIAVVAALFVVGGLVRDQNELHSPAAPRTLAELEATPLILPVVKPGDVCPENPGVNSLGYDYGSGPIYVNGKLIPELKFVQQSGVGGALYDLTYYSGPGLKGPVLVRGRDLVRDLPIQFIAPSGSGLPSETPPWPVEDQLVIDAGHPAARTPTTGYGLWHVRHVIDQGWSGCWGLQIDGSNFSEKITGFIQPY